MTELDSFYDADTSRILEIISIMILVIFVCILKYDYHQNSLEVSTSNKLKRIRKSKLQTTNVLSWKHFLVPAWKHKF